MKSKNNKVQILSPEFMLFIKMLVVICISINLFPTNVFSQNTLDPSFSGGVTDGLPRATVSARQADGKILVGGAFRTVNGNLKPYLTRLNTDGTTDTTFNNGGSGTNALVNDIVVLADGKILVGGAFSTYNGATTGALVRLNIDGSLDSTFNNGGTGADFIEKIVRQSDGKLYISEVNTYNGTTTNNLARLNADGTLDTAFVSRFQASAFIRTVAIDPDGKVVAIGFFSQYDGATVPTSLIRLNTDGTRDAAFSGGTVNGDAYTVVRQSDGKYVIGGSFGTYNGTNRFGIARVNSDSSIDTTFVLPTLNQSTANTIEIQTDGKILVAGGFHVVNTYTALLRLETTGGLDSTFQIQPADNGGSHTQTGTDGKIMLVGYFSLFNNQQRSGLARLNSNGSVDTSFNGTTSHLGIVSRLVQQADGKILAAGQYLKANGTISRNLVRFNTDGSLDSGFNVGTGTLPNLSPTSSIEGLAVQTNGKILIGGSFSAYNGTLRAGVARLNADGSLDTTFDAAFIFRFGFTQIFDIVPQTDGKVIVGGSIRDTATTSKFLLRLNTDGSLDSTFNTGGTGPNSVVRRIIRQTDGKFLIVGQFTSFNGTARNRVARLNSNGTLDTTFDPGTGANTTVLDVAQQPDGKYLIAGQFATYNGVNRNDLARLNADGSLDTTFDIGTGSNGFLFAAQILPSGKIMIGGTFSNFNGTNINRLARLNADGSLDSSFTSGIQNDTDYSVRAILSQVDGKTLIGGAFESYSGTPKNSLVRLYNAEIGGGTQPILYNSTQDGNSEIYRMNADGTNKQRLTNSSEGEGGAVWSVDGTKVLFTKSISSTQFQFWSMNADGSNKVMLFELTGTILTSGWSPNKQKLLYGKREANFVENLWSINVDGTNNTQLTNNGTTDHIASWSPTGSKIAFGRCTADGNPDDCDIFTMNADGSNQTNLTSSNPFDDDGAKWTPDGNRIVYGSFNNDETVSVRIINANGTNQQTLITQTGSTFYQPNSVSPDGTKIGMLMRGTTITSFEVATMNLDGSNLANLTNNSVYDDFGLWSPDGSKIAFHRRDQSSSFLSTEIYTMNADGSGVVRLTTNNATDTITDWYRPIIQRRTPYDFDGDGKSDIGIYRPSGGEWWINRSSTNITVAAAFGSSTDKIVPGDFTGDGKADMAFFRPSNGFWYILRSEDFSFYGFNFGASGDIPVAADFDGDGKADQAVFRPSNQGWYIQKSSGGIDFLSFGLSGDSPVVADYDGDGKADIAITRINAGNREWWIRRSSDNQIFSVIFGDANDRAVQGDYTGDGKADIAFWRPSNGFWYILRSENLTFYGFPFGSSGDTPTPGDYDGDGKFDAAVFRSSNSGWYQLRTTQGFTAVTFGLSNDIPVPTAYVP